MVSVVDVKNSYKDAANRYHKQLQIEDVVSEIETGKVITDYSRYEILNNVYCRIYFDIECIPKDKPGMIYDLIKNLNEYMKLLRMITDDFKYALTFNSGSANHDGLSYHLILYEYSMKHTANKDLVISFVHSDYGKEYVNYIDCSVYSKPHLFKLPYYIGMTKHGIDVNPDNHHRIITGKPLQCIIQYIDDTSRIIYDFGEIKSENPSTDISRKVNKKILKIREKIVNGLKDAHITNHKSEFVIRNINMITKVKQKLVNQINRGIDKEVVDTLYSIVKSKLSTTKM